MDNRQLYYRYLEKLRTKLIQKYDELGLRASGDYERSLEAVVKGDKLIMFGANHSQFMEHGRSPGGFPPRKAIEDWIDKKQGLPNEFREKKKQFAFIIARKIATEGIKVPNQFNKGKVISQVVDEFLANDIYEMLDELKLEWNKQIQSDIINVLKIAA